MRTVIIVILSFLAISGCNSQTGHRFLNNEIEIDENNIPLNSKEFYFPEELIYNVEIVYEEENDSVVIIKSQIIENSIDSLSLEWFSKFLFAMKEPLLFNKPIQKEVFRFTWLRTFDEPVVIRIEKESNQISVSWKVADGKGGYEPGNLITNMNKSISIHDWDEFTDLVKKIDFWNMKRSGQSGFDGSEWILEGVNESNYHVVSVWTPNAKSEFYKVCNYLIELTNLKIDEKEKY